VPGCRVSPVKGFATQAIANRRRPPTELKTDLTNVTAGERFTGQREPRAGPRETRENKKGDAAKRAAIGTRDKAWLPSSLRSAHSIKMWGLGCEGGREGGARRRAP
jgi:hypothetical protein